MKYEIGKERIEKIIIDDETNEITFYKDYGGSTTGLHSFTFTAPNLKVHKLNISDESPDPRIYRSNGGPFRN